MTMIFTAENAAIAPVNGSSHSGFFPVSSRSRKIRLNTGLMSPIIEEIVVVSTTNMIAVRVPLSFSLA